jgi:hypothetical protein
MSICRGRVTSHSQVLLRCDNSVLLFATSASLMETAPLFVDNNMPGEKGDFLAVIRTSGQAQEGPVQKSMSPELASCAFSHWGRFMFFTPQAQ